MIQYARRLKQLGHRYRRQSRAHARSLGSLEAAAVALVGERRRSMSLPAHLFCVGLFRHCWARRYLCSLRGAVCEVGEMLLVRIGRCVSVYRCMGVYARMLYVNVQRCCVLRTTGLTLGQCRAWDCVAW